MTGILWASHQWKLSSNEPAEPLLVIGSSAVRDWLRETSIAIGPEASL